MVKFRPFCDTFSNLSKFAHGLQRHKCCHYLSNKLKIASTCFAMCQTLKNFLVKVYLVDAVNKTKKDGVISMAFNARNLNEILFCDLMRSLNIEYL